MHDTTAMLIELGAVILALGILGILGILGRLAGRVGFSPIPLYLLAGLAFGRGGPWTRCSAPPCAVPGPWPGASTWRPP
ncbi:hypothetical protein ACF068_06910 [Streptomyces sp. NPDC016309]|uniref:hypothetical protein n=1 Tax=Streptomyces sp. NPDC016309 TaxID=3364965 RepID=UPI0036F6E8C2